MNGTKQKQVNAQIEQPDVGVTIQLFQCEQAGCGKLHISRDCLCKHIESEHHDIAMKNVDNDLLISLENKLEQPTIKPVIDQQPLDPSGSTGTPIQHNEQQQQQPTFLDSLRLADQIEDQLNQIQSTPKQIQLNHSNPPIYAHQPDRTYKCAWRTCEQLFLGLKQFQDHLVRRHLRGRRAMASDDNWYYQCSWNSCKKLFQTLQHLQTHIKMNHVWDQ